MADMNKGGNVKDKAQETMASARQTAYDAKSTAQAAGQQAKETASNLTDKAKDVATNVAHRAQDVASHAASTAAGKTEDALSSVGQGMSSLAGTLRHNAPHEGMLGSAAGAVASRLDESGRYLQQHDLNDMTHDLQALVRSHPFQSLCVAFTVGWLLGMVSRR